MQEGAKLPDFGLSGSSSLPTSNELGQIAGAMTAMIPSAGCV